ncbi:MAG: WecB/TagA/CpsF family glycosyltransferase [Halioglobus sp.]|nr:WecB/TagA/CpsF family glycosyltransferase [Halioglobus sp.]
MNGSADDMVRNCPRVDILGVPVAAVRLTEVIDMVDRTISGKDQLHIGVVNAAKVVNMRRDPLLGEDVLSSDIILADGAAIVLAGKVLRRPLPERVAGIDLMFAMLRLASEKNYRVFCLGATEEISRDVAHKIAQHYPGVILAGRRNGYFSGQEESAVAHEIGSAQADILFVAMTSPKKESFMAKWMDVMNVPVVHGVGGSFDVMAGKVERAPERWQKLGLEWLYRVKQEPRRLWRRYLVTNTLFVWMLLKALIGANFARNGQMDSQHSPGPGS